MSNPWSTIPLADYELHMTAPSVQQAAILSDLFAEANAFCGPTSIAILGIAGGNGLDRINPAITKRIVGIDLNKGYLDAVRERYSDLPGLELHQLDLSATNVDLEAVDLVHAALIFEHAGINACLENATRLVAENGTLAVVLQLPSQTENAVGSTAPQTIQRLSSHFQFVDPAVLIDRLEKANFRHVRQTTRPAASGKALWMGLFRAASP